MNRRVSKGFSSRTPTPAACGTYGGAGLGVSRRYAKAIPEVNTAGALSVHARVINPSSSRGPIESPGVRSCSNGSRGSLSRGK